MACDDTRRTYISSPINTGLEQLPAVPQLTDLGLKNFLLSVKAAIEGQSANPRKPGAIQNFTFVANDAGTQLIWDSEPNSAFYVLYRNNTNDFSLARVVASVHAAGGIQRPGFFDVAGQDEVSAERVYWVRGFGPTGEPGPLSSQALTVDSGIIPGDHPWTEVLTPGEVRLVEQNNADPVIVRSYGTAPQYELMHANGTEDSPDSLDSGDEIGSFIFGGWGGDGEVDAVQFQAVAAEDFSTTGESSFTSNPDQTGGDSINGSWSATGVGYVNGMITVDDNLFIVAGPTQAGVGSGTIFYKYNISSNTWTAVSIPVTFQSLTKPVHYNGHIYFGGADTAGGSQGRLYDYNIGAATLTEVGTASESSNDALGVNAIGLDDINGVIYTGSENANANVMQYVIGTDTWSSFGTSSDFGVNADGITDLAVHDGYVYAIVRNFSGGNNIWSMHRKSVGGGGSWSSILTTFGTNVYAHITSYAAYVYCYTSAGDVFEYNPATTVFTQVGGDGINSSWTGGVCNSFVVEGINGYMCLQSNSNTAEVWRFVPNFTGGFAGTWSLMISSPSGSYEAANSIAFSEDGEAFVGYGNTNNADADLWSMGTETFGGIGSGSADFTLSINYLGAMTPIQKWYANGDIAMGYGLGRVFWDESTIRLGIRTTLPTRTLDVAGPDGIHIAQGTPTTPALGDIYVATGSGILTWHDGTAARRTVHAPIALTDNALIRGDGGTTGIQTSGILVSDTDAITGFTLLGIEDTDGTHNLSLKWNENSAANRTLNLLGLTGADRSLTFTADASLGGTNTGDVTLSGTPDYITISGQVITRGAIDLATDITGDLPYANLTPSGSASKLLGRGDSGAGDWQEITLGTGFSISGTTLNFSGGAATVDVDPAGALDGDGSGGDPLAVRVDGVTVIINGSNELEATGTGGAHADTHYEGEADEVDITQLGGYSTVATEFLDGTGDFDTVKDSDLSTSDITTNDVTTSKHGFTPKAPNDSTKFLRGDATWAVPSGGGWALAGTCNSTGTTSTGSWTYSSNVTTVDFIDLSGYKEVLIIVSGVTKDQSRSFCVAVSTNNGSSFLSSSGDYITIDASGVPTNQVNIPNIHNTNATAARYCQVMIHNFSSTDAHSKLWTPMTTQGLGSVGRIPTTSALNAVRVLLSGAGNMTGGDIRIYAR